MTVHPGFGGQAFGPEMMDKVKRARAWRESQQSGRNVAIEVDGGNQSGERPRFQLRTEPMCLVGRNIDLSITKDYAKSRSRELRGG